jgi:hypothetical protein
MVEIKNDKIKSLEEKLRALVQKNKTPDKSKPEVKAEKKPETKKPSEETEEELPEEKEQVFSDVGSSRFIPADLRPSGLSFSNPVGGPSGRLEGNLGDVPSPSGTEMQKKQEEAYQTAKLMYEERENRRIQTGREVMRAPSASPLSRDPLLAGNSFGARGSVAMFNPNPDANDDSGGKLYEVNSDIRDNKKKLAWEVGVGDNDIRKYN